MQNIKEVRQIPTESILVMGNEAIAYGLLDGGTKYAASYPGTPSTEIMEKLIEFENITAGWSTNEAVALEETLGVSINGKDAAFICKSVGLNVAMDPLMTLANSGTNASLVIIVADDPSMHSSQNEQDNRIITKLSSLPMFEPSSIQEAYDYTRIAIKFSRTYKIPVILRTVTRLSHALSSLRRLSPTEMEPLPYQPDRTRFVNIPGNARKNHDRMLRLHKKIKREVEQKGYWEEWKFDEEPQHLFFTSGNATNYLIEAIETLQIPAHILSFKLIHPLPRNLIEDLLLSYTSIFVIEELEPFLEDEIKKIAQEIRITHQIIGKNHITSRQGELTTDLIISALANHLSLPIKQKKTLNSDVQQLLRIRPPVLCAGCPHRSSYVEIKQVLRRSDPIYCNDIGCYSLGVLPPLKTADTIICMGASIPMATSISKTHPDKTAVSIIGDSTFWHSGLSGLANAIWKDADILVIILDNSTTAMTGAQPNPTSGENKLDIARVVQAMGAKTWTINPMEYKNSIQIIKKAVKMPGVKVVISKYPCALIDNKNKSKAGIRIPEYYVDEDLCNGCQLCVNTLGCPALTMNSVDLADIDTSLCNGCGYCAQICRRDAIKEVILND